MFKERIKKGPKGTTTKDKRGKSFTLHHAFQELENDEKWKNRDGLQVPKRKCKVEEATIVDGDDEGSSDEGKRSPTPHSIPKSKRLEGRKYAKDKKKNGDAEFKDSFDAMMKARKEMNEERKQLKFKELEELKEAAERKAAAEERRAAAEEMRAAAESRKVAMEEKKLAIEEAKIEMENEQKLMFMDTSKMDEKQRQYIELCRDQVLAMKKMAYVSAMNAMGGGMGGGLSFMGLKGGGMGMGGGMGRGGMGIGTSSAMGGGMAGFMAPPTANMSTGSIPTQEATTEKDKGDDVHNTEA